jgi:hypothetical protein
MRKAPRRGPPVQIDSVPSGQVLTHLPGDLPREEAFAITTASVIITSRPPDWRQDSACAGVDVNLFYGTITDQAEAVRICRRCPVTEACLWAAMLEEHGHPARHRFGVRGGLLPGARSSLGRVLNHAGLVARYHNAFHGLQDRPGAA